MNKTHKMFLIWNFLLIVLAMACLVYYDREGGLWLKGVTSAWFVLLGAVNLAFGRKTGRRNVCFLVLVEMALLVTMTADVLLGIHFMLGTVVFALGHIVYFAAFCFLEKPGRRDLCLILLCGAVSLFLALGTPYIRVGNSPMKELLIVYAVVISCMLGKAVGNLIARPSPARWLAAVGGFLFWFSDLMLALNLFGVGGRTAGTLCMYTYWPGQIILAHSLFHFVNENQK